MIIIFNVNYSLLYHIPKKAQPYKKTVTKPFFVFKKQKITHISPPNTANGKA
jgi:hypothetical protein